MDYQDKELKCQEKGCDEMFTWTKGEQEFYASKGFTPPKRCKRHRAIKRQRMAREEVAGIEHQA